VKMELGLNLEQFENDFESDSVKDKIDEDLVLANQMRLSSTPSFTLNGVIIKTPGDYDDFKSLIEESIKEIDQ
jgi:predicted DsbA family dithiol-disulfide isomerase